MWKAGGAAERVPRIAVGDREDGAQRTLEQPDPESPPVGGLRRGYPPKNKRQKETMDNGSHNQDRENCISG